MNKYVGILQFCLIIQIGLALRLPEEKIPLNVYENVLGCGLCHGLFDFLASVVTNDSFISAIKIPAVLICKMTKYKNLCQQMMDTFVPEIKALAYLFNSTTQCPSLGFCSSPKIITDSDAEFVKRVLKDKPIKPEPRPYNTTKPIKLLVFTDAHLDFGYIEVLQIYCYLCREKVRNATW